MSAWGRFLPLASGLTADVEASPTSWTKKPTSRTSEISQNQTDPALPPDAFGPHHGLQFDLHPRCLGSRHVPPAGEAMEGRPGTVGVLAGMRRDPDVPSPIVPSTTSRNVERTKNFT